ncbi:MAG TPA: hypothetical protein VJY62_01100 [Bacteroidia bacterium]|nr:hypothetical protein [Bacteroidia bacterium]
MRKQENPYNPSQTKDCVESDGPVSKILSSIIKENCNEMKGYIGELTEAEENRIGLKKIYESKKCCFIETETNYRIYRNLELCVGVELTQAASEIKQVVTSEIKFSEDLTGVLKNIVKAAMDAKQKFNDLRKAACDLDSCMKDKCNCTQLLILTGNAPEKCDDKARRTAACPEAHDILRELVKQPEILLHDMDIIANSAADVTGIQTFSNIKSLEVFYQNMTANAKSFDDFIQEKAKKGTDDLKKYQEELTAATKELTKSDYALYSKRNLVDGEKEAIAYLCCHKCNCIMSSCEGEEKDENRLKGCKEHICEICKKVDGIYCGEKFSEDPA